MRQDMRQGERPCVPDSDPGGDTPVDQTGSRETGGKERNSLGRTITCTGPRDQSVAGVPGFTRQQVIFVHELALTGSPKTAARLAGYGDPAHTGYKLKKKPHIKRAYLRLAARASARADCPRLAWAVYKDLLTDPDVSLGVKARVATYVLDYDSSKGAGERAEDLDLDCLRLAWAAYKEILTNPEAPHQIKARAASKIIDFALGANANTLEDKREPLSEMSLSELEQLASAVREKLQNMPTVLEGEAGTSK